MWLTIGFHLVVMKDFSVYAFDCLLLTCHQLSGIVCHIYEPSYFLDSQLYCFAGMVYLSSIILEVRAIYFRDRIGFGVK